MKKLILASVILAWVLLGLLFRFLVISGTIPSLSPSPTYEEYDDSIRELDPGIRVRLELAKVFFMDNLVRDDYHIDLYYGIEGINSSNYTNSEALSYFLLWNAREKNRKEFDLALDFIEKNMIHPKGGYIMWRLNGENKIETDGSNIASDADLRALEALFIADSEWGEKRYSAIIESLISALEKVAITSDNYIAPYGGMSGDTPWTSQEVWLSYVNFPVLGRLAARDERWQGIYQNMKEAVIAAQLENGLYNSQLTESRDEGSGPDLGYYSINSMWIMVRSAESGDPELMQSAKKSLSFYKAKFEQDDAVYASYTSSGDIAIKEETPWAYALVGRAAILLGDLEFAKAMVGRLTSFQVDDRKSPLYGAIAEGNDSRVGQFTMQEAILTLQDFAANSYKMR